MAQYYNDRYTWQTPMVLDNQETAYVYEHTDGSVSLAILWDGFSTELKDDDAILSLYKNYYDTLAHLSPDHHLIVENHFLRQFDNHLAEQYRAYGEKHTVRCHGLAQWIRDAQADHVGSRGMTNLVFTVMTIAKNHSPLSALLQKRAKHQAKKRAAMLVELARELESYLPGATLCTADEFEVLVWECYQRDRARENSIPSINPRFKLSDRVAHKPELDGYYLKLGDTYTRVALMVDYPDASPNWFYGLAKQFGVEMHITQILKPLDAGNEVRKSASQSERTQESASVLGGEAERGKFQDHNDFRQYVADHNLALLGNCYVLKFHHTNKDHLDSIYRTIKKLLHSQGAVLSDNEPEITYTYWRVSQPGQGYTTPFLRPDHSYQVAHMAPILTFAQGDTKRPQMLRITSDGQPVTFSYPEEGTNHAVRGAKTGSGKGINQVCEIGELFPLGVNFFIAEVGPTYKWIVEGFEGSYFHLDPNTTVISPFPNWELANRKNTKAPLDADIVEPTIGALMPILASPRERDIENHMSSVAEQIMQAMYAFADRGDLKAPTLADFHNFAEEAKGEFEGVHAQACKAIIDNLNSFLSKNSGSRFAQADTLDFSSGIVGVDFKPLMNNQELAKFLLVFVALRFKQLAFADANPCRIVLDELHEFQRIDPVLIATLIKQLTRMGRKEAGAFHGISQEPWDLEVEKGILNQITHRELMYLQSGHSELMEPFRLNHSVLNRWKQFRDPESAGQQMNYRQSIRMVGEEAYDLHLTFPQVLLDLGHSSPRALELKKVIGAQTKDPIERLQLFRQAMEAAK